MDYSRARSAGCCPVRWEKDRDLRGEFNFSSNSDSLSKMTVKQFLELCQSKSGGFAGGPLQMPHLATTYAAMNAIAILGSGGFERAYQIVNVEKMEEFLYSVKDR